MVLVGLAWPGAILATPAGGSREAISAPNGEAPSSSVDPSPSVSADPSASVPPSEEPEEFLGEVIVLKDIDQDGNIVTDDLEPGPGWTFDFAMTGGEIVEEFPTTDEQGVADFAFDTEQGGIVTVTEQLEDGHELIDASCHELIGEDEIGDPLGAWVGLSVTFPVQPEVAYLCFFLNAPTQAASPAPTQAPGGAVATTRPRITLPPTDRIRGHRAAEPAWPGLFLITMGLVVGVALLLTPAVRQRRR